MFDIFVVVTFVEILTVSVFFQMCVCVCVWLFNVISFELILIFKTQFVHQ